MSSLLISQAKKSLHKFECSELNTNTRSNTNKRGSSPLIKCSKSFIRNNLFNTINSTVVLPWAGGWLSLETHLIFVSQSCLPRFRKRREAYFYDIEGLTS